MGWSATDPAKTEVSQTALACQPMRAAKAIDNTPIAMKTAIRSGRRNPAASPKFMLTLNALARKYGSHRIFPQSSGILPQCAGAVVESLIARGGLFRPNTPGGKELKGFPKVRVRSAPP